MPDGTALPCEEALSSPAGGSGGAGQEYRDGARLPCRFLEGWGRTIVTLPIGTQGCLLAEQRRGADFGVAAVTRALGGDLGGSRLAGYGRAVVTWGRTVARWPINPGLIRPGSRRRPAQAAAINQIPTQPRA